MDQLDVRFRKLWNDLSLHGEPYEAWNFLQLKYRENRHYHTLDHIAYGLEMIDIITEPVERIHNDRGKNLVKFAFWWHDCMPDEVRSSDIAELFLHVGHLPQAIPFVRRCIGFTSHKEEPSAYWHSVMVDADLAILGANRDKFDEYEIGVRKEYAKVPDVVYAAERVKILNSFLTRKSIYYTLYCQRELEAKARENLSYSIEKLLCLTH